MVAKRVTGKLLLKWHRHIMKTVDAIDHMLAYGEITDAERGLLTAAANAAEQADCSLCCISKLESVL